MKIELSMAEMASLMLACTICDQETDEDTHRWKILHDKLYEAFDKAYNMKVHSGKAYGKTVRCEEVEK